eukprot:TRINITY_DN113270_c0_g1_i1.p1 TRINITY_DN113270_c0_g1~~TRINITY_DN113270_c0_g1_i1.p1  ORF type:complete len:212 (+),score=2.30 TRINITY_DN113270_c0_g1_i1:95-730(+)
MAVKHWVQGSSGPAFPPALRLLNGEAWGCNPGGLPPAGPHGRKVEEEDWWMRHNDRTRTRTRAGYTFYQDSPFAHKSYNVSALEKDHPRRVFKQLARQGHSFSQANVELLRESKEAQKHVQTLHAKTMGVAPTMNSYNHGGKLTTPWNRKTASRTSSALRTSCSLPALGAGTGTAAAGSADTGSGTPVGPGGYRIFDHTCPCGNPYPHEHR